MNNNISIIGISLKLWNTEGVEGFRKLILDGKNAFHPLPDIRKNDMYDRFGEFEIATGSFLDRIDLFDNEYFKISSGEAERMDPEQRLMLEYAVKAVNNAGYSVDSLKGQRIGIFHTISDSIYRYFFDDPSNLSIAAHTPAMIGTRVANFMDWRGPVLGIETTCSSSLVALYYACESIKRGECTMALVGGVNLEVAPASDAKNSPIISKTNDCRPFDDKADGTLGGEGVCCILIKKESEALKDRDPIYATIKGGAINHGGALIQNVSSPSPISQAEVIKTAWENSEINPMDVRFIEAHGTGTILGDPIEFRGVTMAFENSGHKPEKKCSISSVKGQIGHLDAIAGIVGLVRLVIALKTKHLLPQVGFTTINEHIDEENAPVMVQRNLSYWESSQKRLGGISSFGLSGTNVHIVAEEYISAQDTSIEDLSSNTHFYMLKVFGATIQKALKKKDYLIEYLNSHPELDLRNFCYSINKLAASEQHSRIIFGRTRQELVHKLNSLSFVEQRKNELKPEIYLLVPEILKRENLETFISHNTSFQKEYTTALDEIKNQIPEINEKTEIFLCHYCALKTIITSGLRPDKVIGAQSGKVLTQLITGNISLIDAIQQVESDSYKNETFNRTAFMTFLDNIDPLSNQLLLVMGQTGEMSDACKEWKSNNPKLSARIFIPLNQDTICQEIIVKYSNEGSTFNLKDVTPKGYFLQDFELPILEKKRFWPAVVSRYNFHAAEDKESTSKTIPQFQITDIKEGILAIWRDKLRLLEIDLQEDFFDIGGTSLLGLDVLNAVEKKFKVELEYPDIFEFSTIQSQIELLMSKLSVNTKPVEESTSPKIVSPQSDHSSKLSHLDREKKYQKLVSEIKEVEFKTMSPRSILLTGGTGFLGVYFIKELLTTTKANLTCLIRSDSDESASKKLINQLKSYFPNENLDYNRLTVIKGDITKEHLDLTEHSLKHLVNIDTVYHLAANVSHYGKAFVSETVNFQGTVNMLEWAKKSYVKYFNHISTTAVIDDSVVENMHSMEVYETDLNFGQDFGRSVYSVSKYKAEVYIKENKDNLNLKIFRIGNIGGDSKTGLFQKNIESNILYQRIKSLAGLNFYCDEILAQDFEVTPVDLVCKAAIQLSFLDNSVIDTFHLFDTNPLFLNQLVDEFSKYDIILEKTNFEKFIKHLERLSESSEYLNDNSILGVVLFRNNGATQTQYNINTAATTAYLEKLNAKWEYDRVDYFNTIINYCIKTGFIKKSLNLNALIKP